MWLSANIYRVARGEKDEIHIVFFLKAEFRLIGGNTKADFVSLFNEHFSYNLNHPSGPILFITCAKKRLRYHSSGAPEMRSCTVRRQRMENGGASRFFPNERVSDLCGNTELHSTLHILPLTEDWETEETVLFNRESFIVSWLYEMTNSEQIITSGLFIIQYKVDTSEHHVKMRSINYWHHKSFRVKLLKESLILRQHEFKQGVKYNQINILIQMLLLFTCAWFSKRALFTRWT